ncbi:MAG: hypothetical protein RL695_1982, partial [Pseudomonadota bacterium]
ATRVDAPRHALFHQMFEARAQAQPAALALAFASGAQTLTYAALDARANQLARHLRARCPGLAPDDRVAFCLERGLEMGVAMLAILKAGAAYLPIDPAYPAERIAYLLTDAAPCLLLTEESLVARLPAHAAVQVVLDVEATAIARQRRDVLKPGELAAGLRVTPDHLAYVIYTSGSTGQPKGVELHHRGLCNLAHWQGQQFSVTPDSRVLQFASASFDACTWEFAMALAHGASLHLAPREQLMPGRPLCEFIRSQHITHATLPPVAVSAWPQGAEGAVDAEGAPFETFEPETLQTLVVAGEACPPEVARRWSRKRQFYNAYGPTETTVCATIHRCTPEETGSPPIGQPIANTRVYVLDSQLRPQPVGVVGEIYIAGSGVARGYHRRPELTAERFLVDPFASEPGARMYRSGDLGRWRDAGVLEYFGRNDQQVKIRGFRIEPGEIEARLVAYPGIRDAAVLVREDQPGDRRLVAYLTLSVREPQAGQQTVQAAQATSAGFALEALRQQIKQQLPDYLWPAAYVILDQLPLTPNGKLDRKALPAPEFSPNESAYSPPAGELETLLVELWQTLLGQPRIGRHDNFFDLGGHSLLIVRLLEQMRQCGLHSHVRQIFTHPTPAGLAAALLVDADAAAATPDATLEKAQDTSARPWLVPVPPNQIPPGSRRITPDMLPLIQLSPQAIDTLVGQIPGGARNIQDIYPLAPLQEGILFHHILNPDNDAYILPILMRVDSPAQRDRFVAALQQVIARHDILRSAFHWEGQLQPVQVVQCQAVLAVEAIDSQLNPGRDLLAQMQARMAPQHQWLDLRRAPLIRLQTADDVSKHQHYLLLQLHHIISDHVSLEIILQEIQTLLAGSVPLLQPLPQPLQYRNHVAQTLQQHGHAAAEAHFRARLGEISEPTAPFGLVDVHGDGGQIDAARLSLPAELSRRLRQSARQYHVSPATLFHVALALVLARTSGRDSGDVVFGSVLSGRLQNTVGADQMIGMFINTLPLRLNLQGQGVAALVEQTHRELIELLRHEQATLALAQRCSGLPASTPLFSAMLNYRHSSSVGQGQGLQQAHGFEILASQERTNYPLTLNVDDLGSGYTLETQIDRRVSAARFNAFLQTALSSLVDALAQGGAARPALELDVLPPEERQTLLENFSALRRHDSPPPVQTLHARFEAWASTQPTALAVSDGDEHLTYGELDARANQWAHELVARGMQPDQRVAICCERGLDMIVGLLAILKAGGAYLPIDPDYPAERMAYTLADAAPEIILTQQSLKPRLPASAAQVIALDVDRPRPPRHGAKPQRVPVQPQHLAYVIYTSGSTGHPKGVMIEHRQVTRLFDSTAALFDFGTQDVWTLFHSFAFDFSVWEIWGALLHGGRLVIVPQAVTRSPQDFYRLLCREQVTVLNQTPSAFRQLIAAQGELLEDTPNLHHGLRQVIFGGEALEMHTLRPWVARNGVDQPRLVNMYGITETTVHVTFRALSRADIEAGTGSNVGIALPDLQVYLLDARLQPVPLGVPGEIHVGGAGLARGYLNRPALTAERFIPHPYASDPAARLYKSGDLARWCADGTLEYLGRNDHQVKIRGFRIELGEIEAQIAADQRYADVVVLAREDVPGAAHDKRLVAYLTLRDGENGASTDLEALKTRLRAVLPEYMVPAAFVLLAQMPLTAHGKRDVRALPVPGIDDFRQTGAADDAPQGELESLVARVWQQALGLPDATRIRRHDDFFELGGHSLLIVQVLERLRQAGVRVDARSIFEYPTPAALAGAIAQGGLLPSEPAWSVPPNRIPSGCMAITPDLLPLVSLGQHEIDLIVASVPGGVANIQDIYPLAPLQEGLLFHHQLNVEAGDTYILPTLLHLQSVAQCDAFLVALRQVVQRHDILRSSIVWRGLERAVQVVLRQVELSVEHFDLDGEHDPLRQLEARIAPHSLRMDLQKAPLLQIQQAGDPQGKGCYLVLLLHHIISDHVSLEILVSEVFAILSGQAAQLPVPLAYRSFVAQALTQAGQHDGSAYFRARLADVEEPT